MTVGAPVDDPAAIEELRARFDAVDYTAPAIQAILGAESYRGSNLSVPVHARRLKDEPLHGLIRLFFLSEPTRIDEVEPALGPGTGAMLADLGLVTHRDGVLEPLVRIVPHADMVIASDPLLRETSQRPDHVAGFTRSGEVTYNLTPRPTVERSLDVGTGSGVQALALARHSGHVVATDVNPRALAFTAFNARLNGVTNIETRLGSTFDSVSGERFGLVVCNAPYVVSPDTRFTYRDAGAPADAFSEGVVRRAPDHLDDDGFATLAVSWIGAEADDWRERPARWVAESGCDALVLVARSADPLEHALAWNREDALERDRFEPLLDRWVGYFRDLGVDAVHEGVIVLRRRPGRRSWVRAERVSAADVPPAGAHLLRMFQAGDRLGELGDDAEILELVFVAVPGVRFEQVLAGDRRIVQSRVRLVDGLQFAGEITPETAELLLSLDGCRTFEDALRALQERFGLGEPALERLRGQALEIVKEMWATGYLEVAGREKHEPAGAGPPPG